MIAPRIALDTNIVLRYLIKDDADQAQWATHFLLQHQSLLLPTVVLEAAWVMGSQRGYALEPATVAERLRHIAGLPTVSVEQAPLVAQAINWYEAGMDFADALHLALSGSAGLATFDQGIKTFADQRQLSVPVALLPDDLEIT